MARQRFRLGVLLGCLMLALVLWGFVTLTRYYEAEVPIPLTVVPPQNQALLSTVPEELTVTVRGTGLQILNLMYLTRTASCEVDLAKLLATTQGVYTVEREHFVRGLKTPDPVRILSVSPASVTMATGDLHVKTVPVELRTNIAMRNGFVMVGPPMPEPPMVEIRGTQSVVNRIDSWPSQKLSLADVHARVSEVVNMSDSLKTLLNVVPPRVRVHANVQQYASVDLADVPLEVTEGTVLVVPSRVRVVLGGGVDELANVSPLDVRVSVPAGIRGTVTPQVTAPPSVQVLAVSPAWVRVMNMASP